jgi:hypothetical protein
MGEHTTAQGVGVTPGEFIEGDQVIALSRMRGQTYLVGEDRPDGRVMLIRSCRCGGWFEAVRAEFVVAPIEKWRR